jgi:hypothetical protein
MKTFNATELNKSAAKVFREADKAGSVKINHDRYPDKVFVLEARERRTGCQHEPLNLTEQGQTGVCPLCGEGVVVFKMSSY